MTRLRIRLDRWHLVAIACLAVLAWLYTHRLADWLIDDDEEGYLYAAWRISRGALPYRDFITPQLPAFLYPGALLMAFFGRDPAVLRLWSSGLTLVAASATYLTGRRLFGPVAGLVALVAAFLIDDMFAVARAFRPEATMLACAAVALYCLARVETGDRPTVDRATDGWWGGASSTYALASLLFGAALLAKLFGALPWAAALAYVLGEAVTGGRPWRRALGDAAALVLPGLVLVAVIMGGFLAITPETLNDVLLHHLRQGAKLSRAEVIQNALAFYARALHWHASYVALLPAGLVAARRLAPRRWALVAWQLPTLLAFLVLSRQLWARHLVYLLPAAGLLAGAAAAWMWAREVANGSGDTRRGDRVLPALLIAGLAGALALPHLLEDFESTYRRELGTARLASLVRAFVPEGASVVGDGPGAAFYGGRLTTKHAAGLSEGATESGQITGADLLAEMEHADVEMVLMDTYTQSGQLADMADYDAFATAIEKDYRRVGRFWRFEQPYAVYVKASRIQPKLDFGWAELVAIRVGRSESPAGWLRPAPAGPLAGGETLTLDLVWRVKAAADRPLTAFVHLVGPQGEVWSQGDRLLDNALARSTEEWQADEVVATPLELKVVPGTPPGAYALAIGVYDHESGLRLHFTDPATGDTRDAYEAGVLTVGLPPSPPAVRQEDFGASAVTRTLASGPFRLLALQLPSGPIRAGDEVELPMTWQLADSFAPRQAKLTIFSSLGPSMERAFDPADFGWPASELVRNSVVGLRPRLVVPPDAPTGTVTLTAAWQLDSQRFAHVDLGAVRVEALPPAVTSLPAATDRRAIRFGQAIELATLAGWQGPPTLRPSEPLTFTLFWQAGQPLTTTFTVLIHLVDGANKVVAQADGPPASGARPMTGWRPGELIADQHTLAVPALAPGDYRLLVGLYDPRAAAMPRIPATADGIPSLDGRAEVAHWTIGGP